MQAFPKPEFYILIRVLNLIPIFFTFSKLFSFLLLKRFLILKKSLVSFQNLQYSDLYSSGFIWLLQGHLPTVGLNNRQGTPKGAKKKLLNLLSPFPKYVPKYFKMTKMQKTCTKKMLFF